jgi:hypothetical protein
MIYVAEVTYYDLQDETEKTVLFGTRPLTTKPTDTPADTEVKDRVVQPALVRRDVFDTGTTGGASRVGYGELELRNDDGALDWLNTVALDGRRLVVRVAESAAAAYPSGYQALLVATMEELEITQQSVRIRIRDRQVFTSRTVQTNRYGGTNVLPAGVDGIVSDLKGKPKPIVYGAVYNVEPPCVNTSRLIYQVNDGELRDVMAVYDSGALLGRGADYADQAALETTGPLPGTYRVWKAGGMFRLGTTPAGQVTCDAVEGAWPADRTAAQVFKRVLVERAGRDPSELSSADVAALDALQRATVGIYVDADTTVTQVLDRIAQSVGAWWAADVNGLIRVQRLDAPSGDPVLRLNADTIRSMTRQPLNDNGLPVYRVTVRCVPNYTVQTNGLVGQVSAARRARLAQPYQDGSATDTGTLDTYLLSPEKIVETALSCRSSGEAEATRLLALYGTKRDRIEVIAEANAATLAQVDLGVVVEVQYQRFGLQDGKLFRILGYQLDPVAGTVSLTLWG